MQDYGQDFFLSKKRLPIRSAFSRSGIVDIAVNNCVTQTWRGKYISKSFRSICGHTFSRQWSDLVDRSISWAKIPQELGFFSN